MTTFAFLAVIVCLLCGPVSAEVDERGECETHEVLSTLAFAGLASAATWNLDHDNRFARGLSDPPLDKVIDFGNTWGSGWVIGGGSLGVYATGLLGGGERMHTLGADMIRSYALSGTVTIILKRGINRTRPSGGAYSFPSGHTSSAFSLVPALHHHLGWKASGPATALGVITAMGRMQDRHHYLSDVIFGAALGWVAGDLVIRVLRKEPGSGNVMVSPGAVGWTAGF